MSVSTEIKELFDATPHYAVLFYKLMSYTSEERGYDDILAEAAGYPETATSMQDTATVLGWLVAAGAMGCRSEEEKEYYKTTPGGLEYINENSPRNKFRAFITKEHEHRQLIADIFDYCAEPRSISALEDRYAHNPAIAGGKITPNYLVMELERVGALEWRDGWVQTAPGAELMNEIR